MNNFLWWITRFSNASLPKSVSLKRGLSEEEQSPVCILICILLKSRNTRDFRRNTKEPHRRNTEIPYPETNQTIEGCNAPKNSSSRVASRPDTSLWQNKIFKLIPEKLRKMENDDLVEIISEGESGLHRRSTCRFDGEALFSSVVSDYRKSILKCKLNFFYFLFLFLINYSFKLLRISNIY